MCDRDWANHVCVAIMIVVIAVVNVVVSIDNEWRCGNCLAIDHWC